MIRPIWPKSRLKRRFEDRVDGRQQRLHHVVQQMADAEGAEHGNAVRSAATPVVAEDIFRSVDGKGLVGIKRK